MRNLIVSAGLMLVLAAVPAWAKWVKQGAAWFSKDAVEYYDPDSITRNGNFVRVTTLQDIRKPKAEDSFSRIFINEFDCKGNKVRILSATTYDGHMKTGKILKVERYIFDRGQMVAVEDLSKKVTKLPFPQQEWNEAGPLIKNVCR